MTSVLSPAVVYVAGAAVGAAMGAGSARLVDLLPARSGITHVATSSARAKRNVVLVILSTILGIALAHGIRSANAPLSGAAVGFAFNALACAALLTAAAIDIEHMMMPNELTLGVAAFGLVTSPLRDLGLRNAIVGAICAAIVSIVPAAIYKKLRGHSGVGFGDAKLTLAAGAWFGAAGAIFVLFAGAVQSSLAALLMRVFGMSFPVPESVKAEIADLRARAEAGDAEARALLADDPMAFDAEPGSGFATARLPMGPFLVLGFFEFLLFREPILVLTERLLLN
ncbi:MAG: prepilin peptidase [Polyangiaceae bacterium]|nr:prepilin peptidase [Polyangiaceae bacterium]